MRFDALDGDNWSERAARSGFSILVEYVRAGHRQITYGQWDEEIVGRGLGHHVFLTQYGRPAGLIGNACAQYAMNLGVAVPPINLMIVNRKDGLPGHGANEYIRHFCHTMLGRSVNPERLSPARKRAIIDKAQDDIRAFPDWEDILRTYGLAAVAVTAKPSTAKRPHPDPGGWHRGPESEEHKSLKRLITDRPQLVGLPRGAVGKTEHKLWSGDRLDVYFAKADLAVEVKTGDAGFDELHRGIFQCVKYKAILRAQKIHDRKIPEGDGVLAIGGRLPLRLHEIARLFGVTVFENIGQHNRQA